MLFFCTHELIFIGKVHGLVLVQLTRPNVFLQQGFESSQLGVHRAGVAKHDVCFEVVDHEFVFVVKVSMDQSDVAVQERILLDAEGDGKGFLDARAEIRRDEGGAEGQRDGGVYHRLAAP